MHWADVIAQRLADRADSHVIATGITPSGPIHVGNMREVLTADLVRRACERIGLKAELVYVADSADPLRKVYPFLDEEVYAEHVGRPLATIPAPDGEGSYTDYFLQPFFTALDDLGVEYRLVDAYQSYLDGLYTEAVQTAIENRERIRRVITEISQRPLADDWFPYNPVDEQGRMHGLTVTSCEWPWVEWVNAEGEVGRTNIERGGGKLPWRLDWPARWKWLGVTFEGYGKDHSAAGGSWDTGQHLAPIFGGEAPMGQMYEWIYLKGKGAMASSRGNTISAGELLRIVPPEIMRYLISRVKPGKHIDFDPGEGLISLADEYERLEEKYHTTLKDVEHVELRKSSRKQQQLIDEARKFELAQGLLRHSQHQHGLGISFSHLSTLCQIKSDNEPLLASLSRTHGIDAGNPEERLVDRISRMRNWIDSEWFPESARIKLAETIQDSDLNDVERDLLKRFVELAEEVEWNEEGLQTAIRTSISDAEMAPRQAFQIFYRHLFGRQRGPKLAALLVEFGRERVLSLLNSVN